REKAKSKNSLFRRLRRGSGLTVSKAQYGSKVGCFASFATGCVSFSLKSHVRAACSSVLVSDISQVLSFFALV
ncbi:hypothetical protein M438DRAFT_308092, partial [Aureobasidium pullulans EXF-150]